MRKLTTIILFFHLCIFCSASEYVTNGNFEYHSGIPNDHSQLVNLNNWNSSTCVSSPYQIPGSTVILTAYNHSPDYFWVNGGYDFFLKPPHSGQGIVGMWEYEMIRQELSNPLSLHTQYIFSMYVRSASVNTLSESTLQIFLSTDEPKYGDDGSCDHGCFPTYMVTEAQKLTVINSINLSDAKFVNMNSEWVHVTFAFTPTAIDNSGTANAIYNWLGIQTILNNPSANVDPYSSCLENYILIDDVSITDMCDNICVNTMPAFSYYIFQNGTKVFDTYTDLIGVVPSTGQPSIFSTFIEDAT